MKFAGEKVLISNAFGPIGLEIVRNFVEEGAKVIATVRCKSEEQELRKIAPSITTIVYPETRDELKSILEPHLPIRKILLVHLFRLNKEGPLMFQVPQKYEEASHKIRKNFFLLLNVIFSDLSERRLSASFINLSTTTAFLPIKTSALASANRATFESMRKSIALAGGCLNIRFNSINVGVFPPMFPDSFDLKKALARCPISRAITLGDFLPLVYFLLGEDSEMITGTFVPVDGGLLIGYGH